MHSIMLSILAFIAAASATGAGAAAGAPPTHAEILREEAIAAAGGGSSARPAVASEEEAGGLGGGAKPSSATKGIIVKDHQDKAEEAPASHVVGGAAASARGGGIEMPQAPQTTARAAAIAPRSGQGGVLRPLSRPPQLTTARGLPRDRAFEQEEEKALLATEMPAVHIERKLTEGYVMSNEELRTAVTAWCSDEAAAEATYGPISTWNTGAVTDMSKLFAPSVFGGYCGSGNTWNNFNADISEWDGKCGESGAHHLIIS